VKSLITAALCTLLAAAPGASAQQPAAHGAAAAAADTRLVAAMKKRDVAAVRALAAEGVGVNAQDAESASALHWAAHWNDLAAVRALLAAGAEPNLANRFGVTPLHEAATVNNAVMLEAMLDAGGNPNAELGEGETVLMTAARAGNAAAVRALLAHGANPDAAERWRGQTALMWAAIENHAEVIELLIKAGADVNRSSTQHDWIKISYSEGNVPKTRDLGGLTALQFAARQGSSAAAQKLLAASADASRPEPMYQLTALQLAIVNGHYTLAKTMLAHGISGDDGSLYLAVDTRNLGFYAQRANPPEKDGDVTSLDVIVALLEHGANPNLPYTKGIPERTVAGEIPVPAGATPLDRAATASDFDAIAVLLAGGANPSVAADDGVTPLMLVVGHVRRGQPPEVANDARRRTAIRALIEHGADVDAVLGDSGNSAQHLAAARGAADIVALLEELGAAKDAKNTAGETAADILARS
jgi:ankyrin repeat protein